MNFSNKIVWDIKDKVCLITGGNSGIGRETALELIKQGAGRVIIACRDLTKGEEAVRFIRQEAGLYNDAEASWRLVLKQLDLSSLASIRHFSETLNSEETALHVLINNAGVYAPNEKALTTDGFELTFGTNHVGHFLLTKLLMPLLKRSAPARVIVVSCMAYKFCFSNGFHIDDVNYEKATYDGWMAYCQSKLANILFGRQLAFHLNKSSQQESGVTVYTCHPGSVKDDMLLRNRSCLMQWFVTPFRYFCSSPKDGTQTIIYCATKAGIERYSGLCFAESQISETWAIAHDDKMAERLWELTEQLIAYKNY